MVKVISTSNAAQSCRLPWDVQTEWQDSGSSFKIAGVIPVTNSQKPHLNTVIIRSKCEKEAWQFCDGLHLLLNHRRIASSFYRSTPTQHTKYSTLPSVRLDTWLRLEAGSPVEWGAHTNIRDRAFCTQWRPRFVVLRLVSCEFMTTGASIFFLSRGDKGCFFSENLRGVGCS